MPCQVLIRSNLLIRKFGFSFLKFSPSLVANFTSEFFFNSKHSSNFINMDLIKGNFGLIFFALLAKNILNYGGKFQISDEKQNIIFIIDENFKFPKINLLTGYSIITWSKINLTFQPNKTKYKMHNVDLATWKYLQKKAFKTYVPKSIQSRKLGAGAGLLDND